MIIDRLVSRINALSAPIVVGLDPRLSEIPSHIKKEQYKAMQGFHPSLDELVAVVNCIELFNIAIIDQIHDIVPAIKPQIAMYEQFGTLGIDCYLRTIRYAKSKGLIVIGDIKRGDIASTAAAYSAAHLGRVQMDNASFSQDDMPHQAHADFITINPYMGYDSIEPYLSDCEAHDKGLFVLVKTSNNGSRDIQDVITQNGKSLYAHVGGLVNDWGQPYIGESGYSRIGAVVGATHPFEAVELRKIMPNTFFLVPGYGAQGGSGKDLKDLWTENFGAIVNSSRGITGAYQSEKYKNTFSEKEFAEASRQAVLDMKADLGAYM